MRSTSKTKQKKTIGAINSLACVFRFEILDKMKYLLLPVISVLGVLVTGEVCRSPNNTFHVKVNLFAGELGESRERLEDQLTMYRLYILTEWLLAITLSQVTTSLKNAMDPTRRLVWKLARRTRLFKPTSPTFITPWVLPMFPTVPMPTHPNWGPAFPCPKTRIVLWT